MKNSDILYLIDAVKCNPNGDPDKENKPRMDIFTGQNLVSDVRLKRYMRDYWSHKNEIFVSTIDDAIVDSSKRIELIFKKANKKYSKTKIDKNDINWLLDQLIDVRLFGTMMTLEKSKKGSKGSSTHLTGPVQFTWGTSLHKVFLMNNTISTIFSGATEDFGTFGQDYRVYYSLLGFRGIISKNSAKKTRATDKDITSLDDALLHAIPSETLTRSKLGQQPRLLLRVEYNDDFWAGDLRDHIKMVYKVKEEEIRSVNDYSIEIEKLVDKLQSIKKHIHEIKVWVHDDFSISYKGEDVDIYKLLEEKIDKVKKYE